ncbi:UDP-glucose 4-epimerase-like isoform X2 [Paramacrobiotus metropolitanus]|uniref:UDP-glucose 4-epimerase-like isoform X2 n=1 Tax=Paramacrobiotus metropolitanus TaxID=2943436 RepID=UPI0024459773|nr:UDP-glucose 4-epimerase-like isoform X2 [Paramacrobiotus metropolitanus]
MDTNEFLTVLVTGGAGYIGSHCVIELLDHGFQVVIVDNCEYAGDQPKCLDEIKKLTGKECAFYNVDIRNHSQLVPVFENHNIFCIIHCAALKSVAQSVMEPLSYYDTNVCGTVALLKVASLFSVKRVIFSSSCSVYGSPGALPVLESNPIGATIESPYGRTKYVAEMVLKDLHESDTKWNVVILRYFNTVGCHHSRKIGEQPRGKPQNLMPLIAEVALGNAPFLNVYGADYGTPDGTEVRNDVIQGSQEIYAIQGSRK